LSRLSSAGDPDVSVRATPLVIVLALLAFAVASAGTALAPEYPRLWQASLALIVLGGITPLIYAVNSRLIPVFSRRSWQSPRLLAGVMLTGVASGWLVFLGRLLPSQAIEVAGSAAALAAGALFLYCIMRLFRSQVTGPAAVPLPFPAQAGIDRIGVRFTRLAVTWLLVGLAAGVMLTLWTPGTGRWELVWAHAMLLGWFLSMASGVCYHALPRWTGKEWRWPALIPIHLRLVQIGLPVMLVALALDHRWLFFVAGPVQTLALLAFLLNLFPQARHLPGVSRLGVTAAGSLLLIGATLGASFAIDPVNHVTLRFTHAQTNLFGWTALLVCGVGYYLFPRFAGQPLPWPRLARAQMAVLLLAVIVNATAWWWYVSLDPGASSVVIGSGLAITGSLAVFVGIVARTFRGSGVVAEVTMRPRPRPAARLQPVRPPGPMKRELAGEDR
jgi:hypothetical protein